MEEKNKQVILRSRPNGMPDKTVFEIISKPILKPKPGEVLVKGLYLSLDPYMRGRMSAAKSYAPPIKLGDVMVGEVIGKVVETNHSSYSVGEYVAGMLGWQEWATVGAHKLRKIDTDIKPVSYALGILGMPGLTAYFGLLEVGKPKPGDTVVVSAAAGAVGSVVGQLAKAAGCKVVGIVGSKSKENYIVSDLKFDFAINYKTEPDLKKSLSEICPQGVNIYFDNVGAKVTDAVIENLALGARVIVCGMIAQYNLKDGYYSPSFLRPILVNRARIEGFLVFDWANRYPEGISRIKYMLQNGSLKYKEDVLEGIDNAPDGLFGLFEGKNFGKQLVRLAPDD